MFGKKKLTIEYAPNLDLYFVVEDTSEFVITKEDYQIYELFSKLYETIISADVFNQSSFDYYMSEFLGLLIINLLVMKIILK